MSMQVSCLPQQPVPLPPSDVEKMRAQIERIHQCMSLVIEKKSTPTTYEEMRDAVEALNEIILSMDNSNDFYKIGGFNLLAPLLSCSNSEVISATCELVADLCQNNKFCQSKILDMNLLPQLVGLLDHSDIRICSKALYSISCLCRHNEEAIKHLEVTGIIPLLMRVLQLPDERLRAKAAFFLSYLSALENFRETFYKADVVKVLVELLKKDQDSSSEHLLSALLAQVSRHKQSRIQCRQPDYQLKEVLMAKLRLYESKSEYQEAREYCNKILEACFHEDLKQN